MSNNYLPDCVSVSFIPGNFFDKSINEPFIKKIMSHVLKQDDWIPGDPNKKEPDYFCNGVPFEFTIASDSKRKNNFIQRYKSGSYKTNDIETDVIDYIGFRINEKSKKNYSVPGVHLCVLCLLELTAWVSDEYGSDFYEVTNEYRKRFFKIIKRYYINNRIFNNVFIIFPDMSAKWWVYDVLTGNRDYYQLSEQEIKNRELPFVLIKSV